MHLADDPVVSPEIIKTANYGCWASSCRYVFRQITAASLSRKVWINGRMSTGSQWTSPALENQRITRLLNHLTAVCGMNA